MPRIRTLKPEHRQHRKIGPLDHITYRLWVGMILEADDEGRLVCDAEHLRVTIFGYHPKVTGALIDSSLSRLEQAGLLNLYAVGGTRYGWFPSWHDHQVINRSTPSKLPPYDDSVSIHGDITEDSLLIGKEGKGSERNGEEARTAPTLMPSVIQFQIPTSVEQALSRSPILGAIPRLRDPKWWQAQVRSNGRRGVDFAAELLDAEAWLTTNPDRAPRKDHAGFLHRWFKRADAHHA